MKSSITSTILTGSMLASGFLVNAAPDPQTFHGHIEVQVVANKTFLGCLNSNGNWITTGDCEVFRAEAIHPNAAFSKVHFYNSNNAGCESNWDEHERFVCRNESMSWDVWHFYKQGVIKAGEGSDVDFYARGTPEAGDACSRAEVRARKFGLIDDVEIQLRFHKLDSSAEVEHAVPRRPRASTTAACTGTPTFVPGKTTATLLPEPTAAPGAFRGDRGAVRVIHEGQKNGCLDSDGKWTREESSCGSFEPIWQGRHVSLTSQPGDKYCLYWDGTDSFSCEHGASFGPSYFRVKGDQLVNGLSRKKVPIGETGGWNTDFYVANEPTATTSVEIWQTEHDVALQLEWENTDG